jgi:hypothetical protein
MTFHQWFVGRAGRPPIIPPPHSVVPLIARAGPQGITRQELGQVIDLDGPLLDRLLAAFAAIGQITVSLEGDQRVYRAVQGVTA